MCENEYGRMLQAGMHFRPNGSTSIFLMSVRKNAPYSDRIEEGGRVLIYEGHDAARNRVEGDPKSVDQPLALPSGKPTQNGLFYRAAHAFKSGEENAEVVRVYQKVMDGVWVFNGSFKLVDSWQESDGTRKVYKFRLELVDEVDQHSLSVTELTHSRVIPSAVKLEVYKRDKGRCVICESTENLHFDHDFPYSKGGTSLIAENVRLLCAKHNLQKSDKIE
ncbi:MAG: HNH endonuclease [Calditrichaeota bacterium]|nr:HNH endonuclease [Calditrichota bacterium]MCB9369721.1 HNH endonuclease [Calditrichota bacterium]